MKPFGSKKRKATLAEEEISTPPTSPDSSEESETPILESEIEDLKKTSEKVKLPHSELEVLEESVIRSENRTREVIPVIPKNPEDYKDYQSKETQYESVQGHIQGVRATALKDLGLEDIIEHVEISDDGFIGEIDLEAISKSTIDEKSKKKAGDLEKSLTAIEKSTNFREASKESVSVSKSESETLDELVKKASKINYRESNPFKLADVLGIQDKDFDFNEIEADADTGKFNKLKIEDAKTDLGKKFVNIANKIQEELIVGNKKEVSDKARHDKPKQEEKASVEPKKLSWYERLKSNFGKSKTEDIESERQNTSSGTQRGL